MIVKLLFFFSTNLQFIYAAVNFFLFLQELLRDSQVHFLQLNSVEVATQLTLEDFSTFRQIEPTEYIDDLFEVQSKYGIPQLSKFAEVRNGSLLGITWNIQPYIFKYLAKTEHSVYIPNTVFGIQLVPNPYLFFLFIYSIYYLCCNSFFLMKTPFCFSLL